MSESIRLSTPDGTLVFTVPVGAQCQWSAACTRPAVQMRQHPTMGTLGVCEAETERAGQFLKPTWRFEFEVPDVGRVVVVFGAAVAARRAYRVFIGGVIVADCLDWPAGDEIRETAGIAACAAVAHDIAHAGEPWRVPLSLWALAHY